MSSEIPLTSLSKSKLPSLPSNFAMTIIEKEIELEKNPSSDLITQLVELYSHAIEFYNYNNDPKCVDYQDRMHKMLMKPQIVKTLSPNKSEYRSASPEKAKILIAAELNSTLGVNSHKAERTIIRTIDQNENNTKEVTEKLADNFKKQDNDLNERLQNRRNMNKTFNQDTSIIENQLNLSCINLQESEKSGGLIISKEEMNKKIEEVMEKHFAEKAAKIAEISVKYEKEILEMQEDGGLPILIEQMRENMKNEIEVVSKECDSQRRAEVLKLKQDCLGFVAY